MSKMQGLQEALRNESGKTVKKAAVPAAAPSSSPAVPQAATKAKPAVREGKEYTGAWLNSDFGISLRMVQLRRRKLPNGKKIYLDDLMAEALNDLFLKYDVPTVHHD